MFNLLLVLISIGNLIPVSMIENPVIQWILVIWSILIILLNIMFIIWKWYKEAKKDGKITDDEVDKLFEDIEKEINKKE